MLDYTLPVENLTARCPPTTSNIARTVSGWLRAAVLGANDGIVSTASLLLGVAAASAARNDVLVAGVAGLVAGAMSVAAGEYISVRSQADRESSDLARERRELAADAAAEHRELASIYVKRGLEPTLADQVATQPMATMRWARMPATSPACPRPCMRGRYRQHWRRR